MVYIYDICQLPSSMLINTILFQTAGLCLERSAPKSRCSGHVAGDLLGEDPEPREPWSLVAQGGQW